MPLLANTIAYNNLPIPVPSSPSLGFQSNHTAEFGDLIQLVSGPATLASGTILMNDWALFSLYPSFGTAAGWTWPITLTLYNVDSSSGQPQPGSVITSVTQSFLIPWQPEPTGAPCSGQQWFAPDGKCHSGFNFPVTFNLANIAVPGQFIYGITFNTETFGPNPTGVTGPYIALNVAVNSVAPPTVGTRPNPDTAYLNGDNNAAYNDNGAGGINVFRQDAPWTPFSPAAEFDAGTPVPEPGTFGMMAFGAVMMARRIRHRRS